MIWSALDRYGVDPAPGGLAFVQELIDTIAAALTDFSSARAQAWPTIDAEHFEIHALGDTWAEVTEGTASAWERARYEWDPTGDEVTITTLDSKAFGPGGGWVFKMTPTATAPASTSNRTGTPALSTARSWPRCSRSPGRWSAGPSRAL